MTRREIIEAAKQLVILHGPSNVLEFNLELVANSWGEAEEMVRLEIALEAEKQAERVYNFLGYDSPWSK